MNIIYFTKYTRKGASSRLRSYQYFTQIEKYGHTINVFPLFSDDYLEALYEDKVSKIIIFKAYFNRFLKLFKISKKSKVIIEKELFPYLPAWTEQILYYLGIKYVVDYDDAIFHNYDKSPNTIVKFFLNSKIDIVMKHSQCVIAGNSYLEKRAIKAGAKYVEVIPTVIDLSRYAKPIKSRKDMDFIIGWIGSPSTFKYVQKIAPVLRELALKGAKIHIIGAKGDLGFTENLFFIPWDENSEVENILNFDVGIMPLEDTPWAKGKCSYKLIQYMACGLPVVASPVGMNVEVVNTDKNGYLADSDFEWLKALDFYKNNLEVRLDHGKNGYLIVKDNYTISSQIEKIKRIISD